MVKYKMLITTEDKDELRQVTSKSYYENAIISACMVEDITDLIFEEKYSYKDTKKERVFVITIIESHKKAYMDELPERIKRVAKKLKEKLNVEYIIIEKVEKACIIYV